MACSLNISDKVSVKLISGRGEGYIHRRVIKTAILYFCVIICNVFFYKGYSEDAFHILLGWRIMGVKFNRKFVPVIILTVVVFVGSDIITGRIANVLSPLYSRPDAMAAEREYRLSLSPYHHGLLPSTTAISHWGGQQFTINTNSLGFKDSAVRNVPLDSVNRRVLFIGDSFTEGVGVPYEQTFVGQIDTALSPVGEIEVLNASASSYSASIYYSKIRHLLENVGLQFSDVVVFLDISDIKEDILNYELMDDGSVVSRESLSANEPDSLEPLKLLLKQNSVTVRVLDLVKDLLTQSDWLSAESDTPWLKDLLTSPRGAWTYDESMWNDFGRAGQQASSLAMTKLATLLAEREISLTVVIYPWPTQILLPEGNHRHIDFWEDWAADHDVGFVNLFPDFLSLAEKRQTLQSFYIQKDIHWNAGGHEFVADRFLAQYDLD
jgi:hypothetical protein